MASLEKGIYSKHAGIILEVPKEKEQKMFLTGLLAALQAWGSSIGGLLTAFMGVVVGTTIVDVIIKKVEDFGGWTPASKGGDASETIDGDIIDWDNYNGEYGDTDEALDAMEEAMLDEAVREEEDENGDEEEDD